MESMYFDVAVLSCGGVDAVAGVPDFNLEDAQIKQVVAGNSKRAVVVADSSKHGVVGRYGVADWYDLSGMVSEQEPPNGLPEPSGPPVVASYARRAQLVEPSGRLSRAVRPMSKPPTVG